MLRLSTKLLRSLGNNTTRQATKSLTVFPMQQKNYSSMEEAKKRVTMLEEDPGNEAKLKLYALFKQATVGACNVKKPGVFDFVGQAKWSAWNGLGDMSKSDAEKAYVEYVDSLAGSEASTPAAKETTIGEKSIEGLAITKENGVLTIKFNRPKKRNAITHDMYRGMLSTLNEAAEDPEVKVAVITGEGDYFCSGNDLSNFTNIPTEGPQKLAADGRVLCQQFVDAFINFPKLLVMAVNGPAIGISVTVMGLADLVYASTTSTFHTPFMTLGQSPEGCSSYTFPKIMGYARANDMLLGGRKLTAQEAFDRGLVTDVIPQAEFKITIQNKINYLATLPPKSLKYSKALNRERERDTLLRVNEEECLRLEERWLSEECMQAIMKFMSKSSKM